MTKADPQPITWIEFAWHRDECRGYRLLRSLSWWAFRGALIASAIGTLILAPRLLLSPPSSHFTDYYIVIGAGGALISCMCSLAPRTISLGLHGITLHKWGQSPCTITPTELSSIELGIRQAGSAWISLSFSERTFQGPPTVIKVPSTLLVQVQSTIAGWPQVEHLG